MPDRRQPPAPKPQPPKHTVQIGGRTFVLRTQKLVAPELVNAQMKAAHYQARNMAYGTLRLLIDKILAGNTQGMPTTLTDSDFPASQMRDFPFQDRDPFKHTRLDPDYLKRKVAEGHDPRPLLATGDYVRAMHVEVGKDDKTGHTTFTVKLKDGIHEPSGVPYEQLARWLEDGTRNCPPRPHWRPVATIVRRWWKEARKDIRAQAVRELLAKIR